MSRVQFFMTLRVQYTCLPSQYPTRLPPLHQNQALISPYYLFVVFLE